VWHEFAVTQKTRRLALLILGLALSLGVAGAIWHATIAWVRFKEQEAVSRSLLEADLAAAAVEQRLLRLIDRVEGVFDLMAHRQRNLALEGRVTPGLSPVEAHLRSRHIGFNHLALADLDGRLLWSADPGSVMPAGLVGESAYFGGPEAGQPGLFIAGPLQTAADAPPVLVFSRSLRGDNGEVIAIGLASLDVMTISLWISDMAVGPKTAAFLLGRDGTVLASAAAAVGLGERLAAAHPALATLHAGSAGGLTPAQPYAGTGPMMGRRVLRDAPLEAVVVLDAPHEMATWEGLRGAAFLAAGVISVLTFALLMVGLLFAARARDRAALDRAREERLATMSNIAHGQRMEALGQLAGGVAHDINNVLQAVLGGARLIGKRSEDPDIRRLALRVGEAAERGGAITRRLLAFARRDNLQAESLPVQPLLEGLRDVLAHTLGASVHVRLTIEANMPPLLADRAQLETVLVNLAVNARDAMQPLGGMLDIAAAGEVVPAEGAMGLRPGGYVRLSVGDTGCGMDAETLRRATEPFFTTKAKGHGTGLGLAMVQGFCEQSGGMLDISSLPGQGTRVSLWLPQAQALSPAQPDLAARGPASARACRLMLVDDEPEVLAILAEGLRERGHMVVEAGGGLQALGALAADPAIELLVTDLSMPGIDGLTLIMEARRLRPGLPALLLTGFVAQAEDMLESAAKSGPIALLRKPLPPEVLSDRISALMASQNLAV
jgi:signal transduction histidine kinase/ActR/RegA family two-component response regulator